MIYLEGCQFFFFDVDASKRSSLSFFKFAMYFRKMLSTLSVDQNSLMQAS